MALPRNLTTIFASATIALDLAAGTASNAAEADFDLFPKGSAPGRPSFEAANVFAGLDSTHGVFVGFNLPFSNTNFNPFVNVAARISSDDRLNLELGLTHLFPPTTSSLSGFSLGLGHSSNGEDPNEEYIYGRCDFSLFEKGNLSGGAYVQWQTDFKAPSVHGGVEIKLSR